MATPDTLQWDPNRTPHNAPASSYTYVDIGDGQILMVNNDSRVVTPMEDNPYPGTPLKLPPELMAVDQPHVRTCGKGTATNKGCNAAEGGGCSIFSRYGRVGPVNVIVEKNNKVDSVPCHAAYCGVAASGRPSSQSQLLLKGWRIIVDRTTIPEQVVQPGTNMLMTRQTEVPNLAPMYEENKVGRFAEKPTEKPKRGRPRKHVDRENLATA